MAFWNRRNKEAAKADGQKAATVTDAWIATRDSYGWTFAGEYAELYRRQPAVRTVVSFQARNVAALNLKAYLRVDNDDRVEVDDHPVAKLMRQPNPNTSRFSFMRDAICDLGVYDRCVWRKVRTRNLYALVRIPPSKVVRELHYDNLVIAPTVVYRDAVGNVIPREELVIISGYSPQGDWDNDDGVPPPETLRRVLEEEWAALQNRRFFWRNAARKNGVIQRPMDAPPWSPEAKDRFRTDWDNSMTGEMNAGRTAILEEGMTWNPDSFSPQEAEYIQGRRLTFDEVCYAYGINPALFTGNATQSNIDSYHRQLYQDTFGPLLRHLQDEIELQVLPDIDDTPTKTGRVYVEFNLAEKLQASFEEQMRVLVTAAGVPIVAVNEGRARLNLPKIDDKAFDEPVKPMNVTYGGQPSTQVPTAVPQPGGGPPPPGLNPKPVVNEPPPQLPPGKRTVYVGRQKKAVPKAVLKRKAEAVQEHKVMFERYFRAQRNAVRTSKAAGAPFDMERWNSKLTAELYTARSRLAARTGKLAAQQIQGVYDPDQTLGWMAESSRIEAESINADTADALNEDGANPDDVFDEAEGSRALMLAVGTATAIIGFARAEAAKQSTRADGVMRQKTWVVTSHNSRHPELDGETVDMYDSDGNDVLFSNGLRWPGDVEGEAADTAGCQCALDLSIP